VKIPNSGSGLFLSSSGGHFSELIYIAREFEASDKSQIVTFEGADTLISKLEFKINYLPYVAPRRIFPLIKMLPRLNRILRQGSFDYIASTGAAIAVIGYILAKVSRLPFYYVESIARQTSLSLTTKLLKLMGLRNFFVQSEGLAVKGATLIPHPIHSFTSIKQEIPSCPNSFRIFVALGTIKDYKFTRAIDQVMRLIDEQDTVNWQLGFTKYDNLPGKSFVDLEREQFLHLIKSSDIVICHAGIGILIDCFRAGKKPLVIPRRGNYQEHVDDHQVEIMNFLLAKNLVLDLEVHHSRNSFADVLNFKVLEDKLEDQDSSTKER
jgi:UDP-N-acetylglucosamine transferase subunit ALG13